MKRLYLLAIILFTSMAAFTQKAEDTTDGRFHDDLLDHLVGKWDVSGIVYGKTAHLVFQAEWVLNHQFLRVYEKSEENVPGTNAPYEAFLFIGYDSYTNRYITHLISVAGGICGQNTVNTYRSGNEIKLVITEPCVIGVERFIYEPSSNSWHIESRQLDNGKEGAAYLDLKATSTK